MNYIKTKKRKKTKLFHIYLVISLSLVLLIFYCENAKATALFNSLLETITDFIDHPIPDVERIIANIFRNSSNSVIQQISRTLENKPLGSYSVTEDAAAEAKINSANQIANNASLSTEAQQKLQETSQAIEANVKTNIQLGQDSQQLDVTQQILQNVSQQLSLNAEQQGIIIQQNQQSQIDRSISNVLAAQQAQEVTKVNTASRRENASASAISTAQLGLIRLAGLTPQ